MTMTDTITTIAPAQTNITFANFTMGDLLMTASCLGEDRYAVKLIDTFTGNTTEVEYASENDACVAFAAIIVADEPEAVIASIAQLRANPALEGYLP